MSKRSIVFGLVVACALTGASGNPRVLINVWRGEKTYLRVPDKMEIVENTDRGVTLRYGATLPVDYVTKPKARSVQCSLDRVDFSVKDRGARVAEITVAPDAQPGSHKFGSIEVDVSYWELPPPSQWKYHLDLWQHPWAVARINKVKPFSKEHYNLMRPLWEMLADAGQKTITTTILDTPWFHQCRDAYHSMVKRVKKDDGSWSFDYSLFDEYVVFARSCGLGPSIACYSAFPWGDMVNWETEKGELKELWAKNDEMKRAYWEPFLKDFGKHLKEKGWFEDTYISLDERGPKQLELVASMIATNCPGLKLAMAGDSYPSQIKCKVDSWCQGLGVKVDQRLFKEAAERRAQGLITTYYVCCMQWSPNTFMWSDPNQAYWLGVYPAICGLDGFLRWAWNSWGENPMIDASFDSFPPGDVFLVYPDNSPSIRFLELRNGIVAAEKLRILREEKAITDEEFGKIVKMFDREKAQEGKQDWEAIHKGVDDFIFNLTKSWTNLRPKHSHLRLCAESRKSSFDRMK